MNGPMAFDEAFRRRLHDLFVWRRHVRRFRTEAVPAGTLESPIQVACLSREAVAAMIAVKRLRLAGGHEKRRFYPDALGGFLSYAGPRI
jgi:hypothetical protein